MDIRGKSDRGMVRKQNQDFYSCKALNQDQLVAVVCDGMGGSRSGDVASRLASEVFVEDVSQTVHAHMEQSEIVEMLVAAMKNANGAVYEQSQISKDFAGMGTTLVGLFLQEDGAYVINVGDSRCYYVAGDEISQITEDHSVVGLMVARGQITEEEARNHPNKNLITRAVGTEAKVECDCFYLRMEPGECLLLCSDGLYNMVTRPELLYEITHNEDGQEICDRLVEIANKRGAPDNVTAVLLRY
jgi:protein phosphatase